MSWRETLRVDPDHPCFAGHFPGAPIVPGALLLQWLEALLQARYPGQRVEQIGTAKFFHPVAPGAELTLIIAEKAGSPRRQVEGRVGEQLVLKVSLTLAQREAE